MNEPRGRKRLQLIHDIARGEVKAMTLCREHGLSMKEFNAFKRKYQRDIATVKADLEAEFAGLWISRKRDRLAETQDVAERAQEQLTAYTRIVDLLDEAIADPANASDEILAVAKSLMGSRDNLRSPASDLMKVMLKALRQAAEEMGDLKTDTNLTISTLRSEIVGIDPSDLT